jgi:hypothetical protein
MHFTEAPLGFPGQVTISSPGNYRGERGLDRLDAIDSRSDGLSIYHQLGKVEPM